ncbi:MAG TPA: hypothetical protein VI795_02915 [Patescibacteria group bacterium]|nr:hypothetical protein [Patescibacteria group bacterium]
MPNNDNQQKTGDDGQTPQVSFPSISVEDTLPPMTTSSVTTTSTTNTLPQDTKNPSPADDTSTSTGSAAPSNDISTPQIIGTTAPKKKFAGGKVIATILGLFLLVGGVGAGVFLTGQNQNISEKAATNNWQAPCTIDGCSASNFPTDYVNHYRCNNVKSPGQGCSDIEVATGVESASFQFNCGTEQIDHSGNIGFSTIYHDEPCEPGTGGGGCLPLINIYGSDWVRVSNPSTLAPGAAVHVGIIDRYKIAIFSKAKFTINGVAKETTKKREVFIVGNSGPKMTIFYDDFNITSGETKINAQVEYGGNWY